MSLPDPYYQDDSPAVYHGDCVEVMRELPENSVDALVTDPPAGISFMGKAWDSNRGSRNQWIAWLTEVMEEAYRVMKPGAHGLVWALPRTSHWTGMALEDAGFEVRERIAHHFGSGFPKSASISKNIDKMAGAEREVTGTVSKNQHKSRTTGYTEIKWTGLRKDKPVTEEAKQWEGWGTALKPAVEDYWWVTKPLSIAWCCAKTIQTIGVLESELCKLTAKSAGENSKLTPRGSSEDKGASVPASAAISTEDDQESKTGTGAAGVTSSEAGTSASIPEAASIALNTLSSWKSILEDALSLTSRYTTETESSLITDLKTLNSLLSQITPESMLEAVSSPSGSHSPVPYAEALLSGFAVKLSYIRTQSAPKSASEHKPANEPNESQQGESATNEAASSKPSTEDWWLVRKPLSEKSVAANVLKHGTGALNIDATRVGVSSDEPNKRRATGQYASTEVGITYSPGLYNRSREATLSSGRWPSNLLLSHAEGCQRVGEKRVKSGVAQRSNEERETYRSQSLGAINPASGPNMTYADPDGMETVPNWVCVESCPVRAMDEQSGELHARGNKGTQQQGSSDGQSVYGAYERRRVPANAGDSGGASRFFQQFEPDTGPGFFYKSKASRAERNAGLEGMPETTDPVARNHGIDSVRRCPEHDTSIPSGSNAYKCGCSIVRVPKVRERVPQSNNHPTVKPLILMRYLTKLITPPNGVVLDPFAGSGTTGAAAILEGFKPVLIEAEEEYLPIIQGRLAWARQERARQVSQLSLEVT